MPIRRSALLVSLALATAACAPAARANPPVPPPGAEDLWIVDRLYFGRSIPGGGTVSDSAWTAFLREVVTPRFPSGITVLRGEGQWRDSTGAVIPEASFVLERLHPPSAEEDAAVEAVAAEYKRRFRQEAVLHVRTPADVRFHEEE